MKFGIVLVLSMIKIVHDPVQLVLDIVQKKYPQASALVSFVDSAECDRRNCVGYTVFHRRRVPVVHVSVHAPYYGVVEVLAHELAHVVIGRDSGHGRKWKEVFEYIASEYVKCVKKFAKKSGSKVVEIKGDDHAK